MLTETVTAPPDQATALVERVERARSFPSADLVHAAAGMFSTERVPERVGRYRASVETAVRLGHLEDRRRLLAAGRRELVEGVRWTVEVGPGVVSVRSWDPARVERSAERAVRAARLTADLHAAAMVAGEDFTDDRETGRGVTVWSAKSRARMVKRLAEFDYAAMFATEGRSAMTTLTYPGGHVDGCQGGSCRGCGWLLTAPDAKTCHRHLLAYRKRFERAWGRPLVAVWKREFQRRGAPHYHLFVNAPTGLVNGENYRAWTARVWSEIVADPRSVERDQHRVVGTAVDYSEGARATDPRRLAVYFSKHGSFAAKDYQNDAPSEWTGSVGRFWGYWHLTPAVSSVEVAPDVARAVVRTARRYSAANSYAVRVAVWRKVTTVDRETGELGFRWRKRHTTVPIRRLRGSAGFLVVNDGPVFAAALASASARIVQARPAGRPRVGSAGLGPVGFLP